MISIEKGKEELRWALQERKGVFGGPPPPRGRDKSTAAGGGGGGRPPAAAGGGGAERALLPHQGDVFHEKVLAASYVINGFGKTTGLVQIDELGTLETPILFTNTLSVGTAQTALVKYMLEKKPRHLRDHRQREPGGLRVQRLRPERYPGAPCH